MCSQDFYYIAGGVSALLASITYVIKEYQETMSKELDISNRLQSKILPVVNKLDYNINNYRYNLESEYVRYVIDSLVQMEKLPRKMIIKNISSVANKNIQRFAKSYAYQNVLRNLNMWCSLINKHPVLRHLIKHDDKKYFIKIVDNHKEVIHNIAKEQRNPYSQKDKRFFSLWKLYNYWE